jgi:hypothetical protein
VFFTTARKKIRKYEAKGITGKKDRTLSTENETAR